jgi:hypothetical protein
MRCLLSTLLATSNHHQQYSRCRPPKSFGPEGTPKLAGEEYKSLAGVWVTELWFDNCEQDQSLWYQDSVVSLHLAPDGKVCPMDVDHELCGGIPEWSWYSVERSVCAGEEGDDQLSLSLQLGRSLFLQGEGTRTYFRCTEFTGAVLEGTPEFDAAELVGLREPAVVGSFTMRLALPIKTNASALEEIYERRIASRPPPPPTYDFSDFVGRWTMVLAFQDALLQAVGKRMVMKAPIELAADGSWESEARGGKRFSGTWGMYDKQPHSDSGWSDTHQPNGLGPWLTVLDLVDGKAREVFHLWGEPVLEMARPGGGQPPVAGLLWTGKVAAREYFGQFVLERELVEAAEGEDKPGAASSAPERADLEESDESEPDDALLGVDWEAAAEALAAAEVRAGGGGTAARRPCVSG